jgi:hypothetical protein
LQFLTRNARRACLPTLFVAALALALLQVQVSAHPPSEPDHGLDNETFYPLWAGDEEAANESLLDERVGENASEIEQLGAISDIPLDSPPTAVEHWNEADHREFPTSDASRSIHPQDATLSDGRFVTDAYASIVSVQPSTRARLSSDDQPLYVAPNGTLLGTVDYRIVVPEATTTPDQEVEWALLSHRIETTRLLVNGSLEAQTNGSQMPTLSYESIGSATGSRERLRLEANISTTLRKETRTCTERATPTQTNISESNQTDSSDDPSPTGSDSLANQTQSGESGECLDWDVAVSYPSESLVVSETVEVTVYRLFVAGIRTSYPGGDFGILVYKNNPWLGYETPDGTVRGVWRFYSARDPDWDRLTIRSANGTTHRHSPVHPLQVSAYPIETGPSPEPRENVTITGVEGAEISPPSLPEAVALDVVADPYTASYRVGSRIETADHTLANITAYGLVRGSETELEEPFFYTIPFNRSSLSARILNTTAETTTVELALQDGETGEPIETQGRAGYLVLGEQRLNTTANGTVTATVTATDSGIAARYEPAVWWRHPKAYLGNSTVIYEGGAILHVLSVIYQASIPIGVLLVATFLIDRITGWEIWPPWGRR